MNLQRVTGQPFCVDCFRCGKGLIAGEIVNARDANPVVSVVYADLEGPPFKAYYCVQCVIDLSKVSAQKQVEPSK